MKPSASSTTPHVTVHVNVVGGGASPTINVTVGSTALPGHSQLWQHVLGAAAKVQHWAVLAWHCVVAYF